MMEKQHTGGDGRKYFGTALLCAAVAVLIVLNVILNALASRFGWYLYTEETYSHTIGDASHAVLDEVPEGEEIRVIFCMPEEELLGDVIYALVLNTFRQLAERHDFITIEFANIYLNPGAVRPYRVRTLATGETVEYPITEQSVIIASAEREDDFRVEALQSFFILNAKQVITAYNGEEIAISCLAWVLEDSHPVAAFTTGHGENYAELSAFYTVLLAAGYDISVLTLDEEIPEGVGLVVIANPRWDLDRGAAGSGVDAELDRLADFLDDGGSLFVSLDPYAKADLSGIRAFLLERGLSATQEVIRDPGNSITPDGYTLVTEPSGSPLSDTLFDRIGTYTAARAVVREASVIHCESRGAWQASPLLSTSATAEAFVGGERVDADGPYPVLAASRTESGATVILASSVYLLAGDALNSSTYANRDVIMASLELTADRTTPVGCRILAVNNTMLEDLTMRVARVYAILLTLVLPLAVAAVGAVRIIRRKNR